ncbi:hypothetical protein WR25_07693 isoform C [Diploscapter pachys]|uniref:CUE domain-containing protein n=2 Tax=Diploscapter pachys TaxID=2018661 RepID=A0A2A2JPB1_9BILA|nr:hypothetical protein WR25_07693 isoform C [Diploscapter pachys]
MESVKPSETLLDFDAAMYDFSVMFPKLSRSEIEEALRRNDGDVARTIDDLLAVTEGWKASSSSASSAEKRGTFYRSDRDYRSENLPSSSSSTYHNHSSHHNHNNPRSSSTGYTRLGRRVDRLSIDDLEKERRNIEQKRLQNLEKLDKVTDVEEARILEDEQLALLLQNKDIVRQLQKDKYGIYLNENINYINSFSGASPARIASCDRRRSSNKSDKSEQGPLVPEGPLIDELVILNNSGDLRDKLKSMSKGKPLLV